MPACSWWDCPEFGEWQLRRHKIATADVTLRLCPDHLRIVDSAAETFKITDGDVVVLNDAMALDDYEEPPSLGERLGQALVSSGHRCLVISLAEGQSLEVLDEDAMRAAGWVRAPKDAE